MNTTKDTRFIFPAIPEDQELLAAIGVVALRHTHVERVLRMTVKTLAEISVAEALDATAFESASSLRDRIRRLARQRIGEGQALLRLQALLERCRRASERRNELLHSVWARELDGDHMMHGHDQTFRPIPTVAEVLALAADLAEIGQALNVARLDGFLAEAMAQRKRLQRGPD